MKVLDLFAGCGGLSYGLARAGWDIAWANEIDPDASNTFKANHLNTELYQCDVRELLKRVNTGSLGAPRKGQVDLIVGGPPCQGYCEINRHRSFDDPRNSLVEVYFNYISALQPRYLLMENVTGILTLEHGAAISDLLSALEAIGYHCTLRIMQMGTYGLPQNRWRVFVLGARDKKLDFPPPTHAFHRTVFVGMGKWRAQIITPPRESLFEKTEPSVTVGDAIADLPFDLDDEGNGVDYRSCTLSSYAKRMRNGSSRLFDHASPRLEAITLERIRNIPEGGGWQDLPPELQPDNLKRFRAKSFTSRYGRLSWSAPFSTIMTKPEPYWGRFIHPAADRLISVREAARAQSFPDGFTFTGSLSSRYRQIGNAVPPIVAEAIGLHLIQEARDGAKKHT